MSHTPGPWKVLVENHHIYAKDSYPVASATSHRKSEERLANARLIAAAPDMLAALEAISPMLPRSLSTATWGDPAWTDALGKVEAAIAKARGQR